VCANLRQQQSLTIIVADFDKENFFS